MRRCRFSLDIRPGAVALLAGLYFLLPLRWCARLALAVTVHELGHVAALVLCGTEIYGLRMEGCGLALRCAPPEGTARTVAAAVSGPAAGVGLFCILRGMGYPEGADLSLLYTCVNLLPVLPLDGGRAHLWHEREQAYKAELSPDCRKQCTGCGALALMTEGGKCDA